MNLNATYSVVFPIKENAQGKITHVGLGTKARKIFAGMKVGPGGEKEFTDKWVPECACREAKEEVNLDYEEHQLEEVGAIISHEPGWTSLIRFYFGRGGKGRIQQTKDRGLLAPKWYPLQKLPVHEMPAHYPLLLLKFLEGFRVEGSIAFDPKKNALIDTDLHVIRRV
jgi:ADP-ribose pyrophosphatase YjhB (NUDIX family)